MHAKSASYASAPYPLIYRFFCCKLLGLNVIAAFQPTGNLMGPGLHVNLRGFPMTCKATIRMICEYLEGRLSPSVAATMRAHLEGCTDCRLVLEAAQRTLEVYFDREQPLCHHARVA
jgi:hypothetical protein